MKITVLTENCAGGNFLAEHGLSYLIEHDGERVLLDTGHSDIFIKNAKMLGININTDVDTVVLSHGHWDHANGLRHISNKKLITHPESFAKRYRKFDSRYIGVEIPKEEMAKKFDLVTTDKPYSITENIIFLGSIPRNNNFESQSTAFVFENGEPDFVMDDSALVFIQNGELVIVTACSHSGICNIIEYAKAVTGISKVLGVIGGLHLKHNNKQTQETVKYFKEQGIKHVYPSHCTDLEALAVFAKEFDIKQVKTGQTIFIQ